MRWSNGFSAGPTCWEDLVGKRWLLLRDIEEFSTKSPYTNRRPWPAGTVTDVVVKDYEGDYGWGQYMGSEDVVCDEYFTLSKPCHPNRALPPFPEATFEEFGADNAVE